MSELSSTPTAPAARGTPDASRILVLVSDPGNRQVLTEALGDAYEVVTADPSPDVLESTAFDCCIVDHACLERGREALLAHKADQRPVILPYLLLERDGAPTLDAEVRAAIDDVLTMPTSRRDLDRRIESLLTQRELSRDLQSRNEELLRVNEKLEYLLGAAAHDLRNPLNIAKGHIQLIEESDHRGHVENALDRMEALIENLLTLNRVQREHQVETLEPVPLVDLVDQTWDLVPANGAAIEAAIPTDWTIMADPVLAKQLLENLFRNAIQHSPHGVTIRVGIRTDEDGFYVADDGPGIPETERGRVFESGYSTDSGNGLGLPIVQQVADVHGWTLDVAESAEGGARFDLAGVGRPASED